MTDRSGTETRQRSEQVGVRLLPEEAAMVRRAANAAGVSMAEVLRWNTLAALLPPCSQCGQPFSEQACGPTHAIVAAEPSRHRLIGADR